MKQKETNETLLSVERDPSNSTDSNQRVLFICTGNFYRSRFAEAIFNHHAEQRRIAWTAFSRGLAVHLAEGYLSSFAAEALKARQIGLRHTGLSRMQLIETDLDNSTRRIALDRFEHFMMMVKLFPGWEDRIEYWEIPDLPYRSAEEALPEIERKVIQLLEEVQK
ncbi:MAG TPA: low molecular weight phosphatase family protein [Chthoniobacterales bacterium]|nr:low molecular weight phosphatase family protein [Chthoniobacterales bacterium]